MRIELKDGPYRFVEMMRAQAGGDARVLSDNGLPVVS